LFYAINSGYGQYQGQQVPQVPSQYAQQAPGQYQQPAQSVYNYQPSYTTIVQKGAAAWSQAPPVQAQQAAGGWGYPYQQTQQYSQQQYSQQQQQQTQQQAKQPQHLEQTAGAAARTSALVAKKSRFSTAASNISTSSLAGTAVTGKVSAPTASGNVSSASAEAAKPSNWPPSLKKFVDRSFAQCDTDEDRKCIATSLEKLINKVASDGRVLVHKWDLESSPSLLYPGGLENSSNAKGSKDMQTSRPGMMNDPYGSGGTYTDKNNERYGVSNDKYGARSVSYSSSEGTNKYGASSPVNQRTNIDTSDRKRKNRWDAGDDTNIKFDSHQIQKDPQRKNLSENFKPSSAAVNNNDDDSDYMSLYSKKNKKENARSLEGVERSLTGAELAVREKRANRFLKDNEGNQDDQVSSGYRGGNDYTLQSQIQLGKKNKQRKKGNNGNVSYYSNSNNSNVIVGADLDFESLIVIGTCQKLEKDYFRLTSAPAPSTVRPENILRLSLTLIKDKWEGNLVEYIYMCSQFKSIRQDMTVQHIQSGENSFLYLILVLRNVFDFVFLRTLLFFTSFSVISTLPFTDKYFLCFISYFTFFLDLAVEVYESHARVALECGDLNEYNQCQTQLKQLYSSTKTKLRPQGCGSEMEFTAYRILYYVYLQGNKKYQNGSSDLADIMASLSAEAFK
jgi:hypothetical protein